jgi:hypothetical protein
MDHRPYNFKVLGSTFYLLCNWDHFLAEEGYALPFNQFFTLKINYSYLILFGHINVR